MAKITFGAPIRCLPLILVSMCVTTVILVHLGSHQERPNVAKMSNEGAGSHPNLPTIGKTGLLVPDESALSVLDAEELKTMLTSYLNTVQMKCELLSTVGKNSNQNVFCGDLDSNIPLPCKLHSFGYHGDFSFEKDVASVYGCTVASFDPQHTYKNSYSPFVTLYDIKLGTSDEERDGVKLKTLGSARIMAEQQINEKEQVGMLNALKPVDNPFTMINIEVDLEDQWEVLKDITRPEVLNHVGYLFIELNTGHNSKDELLSDLFSLKKLYDLGFRIYHSKEKQDGRYKVFLGNLDNFS